MSRGRTLADYLRKGIAAGAAPDCVATNGYYTTSEYIDAEGREHSYSFQLWGADAVLCIFVGKFGTDILKSIGVEHRQTFDDGWEKGRVWDRPQVNERLTRAINGGVWELHRRAPGKLYDAIVRHGYAGKRPFTSVFRAITYLNDVAKLELEQIAGVLEEARV